MLEGRFVIARTSRFIKFMGRYNKIVHISRWVVIAGNRINVGTLFVFYKKF